MEKEMLSDFFEQAIKNKDSVEIEKATTLSFSLFDIEDFEKYLIELLSLEWHYSHEDIAQTLQEFGTPNSVEALFKAATKKFNYLDYDDSKAFARKCTWALVDIGNDEAKEALIKLSKNEDSEIADYAKKRIDKWSDEKRRKRHSA